MAKFHDIRIKGARKNNITSLENNLYQVEYVLSATPPEKWADMLNEEVKQWIAETPDLPITNSEVISDKLLVTYSAKKLPNDELFKKLNEALAQMVKGTNAKYKELIEPEEKVKAELKRLLESAGY